LAGQIPLEIFGDGQQTRSFTHVRDVAQGVVLAMESPHAIDEDFNFGHPSEVSILKLAKMLWNICGRVEPFAVHPVCTFEHDIRRRAVDITKATTVLGWEPKIGLEQGLVEFVGWLRMQVMVGQRSC